MSDFSHSKRLRAAFWWVLALVLLAAAWHRFGLAGLALAGGALLFWLLLQFTRAMTVMKSAARRPRGYVRDAAQLHRRLRPGISLLDLMRATGSLGVLASPEGEQPEIYHWTDSAGVCLVCRFDNGRLVSHELTRVDGPDSAPVQP